MSKRGTRSSSPRYSNNPARNDKAVMEAFYYRKLTELAVGRFEWVNMPTSIDTRFIELTLHRSGLAVFYYDKEFDRFLCLRGTGNGIINMYDNPTSFRVLGNTMVNKELSASACVPIWGNQLRTPETDGIRIYAQRLAEIDRTIDININTLRHPIMLVTDPNEKLTMQNLFREWDEGQPLIATLPSIGDNISSRIFAVDLTGNSNVDTQITKLQTAKQAVFNDCMTMLGINNATTTKQERLVASEVGANDSQVLTFRNTNLSTRKQACEEIGNMFGIGIDVQWRADLDAMVDATQAAIGAGDVEATDMGDM